MIKKLLISVATFFVLQAGTPAFSQNETVDTSVSVVTEKPDELQAGPDTILTPTKFSEEGDSISSYRRSKDFSYMKNLDSILRAQKELKADTIGGNGSQRQRSDNGGNTSTTQTITSSSSIFSSPVVSVLLWIFVGAFVLFIIYKLFLSEGFFRRNPRQQDTAAEPQEETLEDSSYDPLIRQALANKNFRLAIRYLYLQTLQKLSASGVIHFSVDKTNYEYVREVAGRSYQNNFASLTLNYEYVWYGKFEIDEDIYQRLQTDFRLFQQRV